MTNARGRHDPDQPPVIRARLLAYAAALAVFVLSAYMAASIRAADAIQRETELARAASRIEGRVRDHVNLLHAVAGLFRVENNLVSREMLLRYLDAIDVEGRMPGIQGIGFAMAMNPAVPGPASRAIADAYGVTVAPWPPTDLAVRFPIVLLEPFDDRNRAALGFDMWSEPVRREAMRTAWIERAARASAPVELVQEIDEEKQVGFLIYIPVFQDRALRAHPDPEILGFVYAPFRAGDLLTRILSAGPLGVRVRARDAGAGPGGDQTLLFSNVEPDALDTAVSRIINVAGRTWLLDLTEEPGEGPGTFDPPLIVLALGGALSLVVLWSARAQARQVAASEALARKVREAADEKDLILQEMRHRLKNAITRIHGIARLTARGASDVRDFLDVFGGRMQAMAAAQDLLGQSQWQRTTLHDLVESELAQIGAVEPDRILVDGPPVDLDESAAQAVGLVVHELATNSTKHGALAGDGRLDVRWRATAAGVEILWTEHGTATIATAAPSGFGSRLIDTLVRAQLGGRWSRVADGPVLTVTIDFPLAHAGVSRERPSPGQASASLSAASPPARPPTAPG